MRCEEIPVSPLAERLARFAADLPERGRGAGRAEPVRVLKNTKVTVVRAGDVVVKAHPPGTGEAALTARLRAARALPGVLLPPLADRPALVAGRLVTAWPAGEPVDPADPGAAPWEAAAGLLARLHATPAGRLGLPPAGGPGRLLRALAQLGDPGALLHPGSPLHLDATGGPRTPEQDESDGLAGPDARPPGHARGMDAESPYAKTAMIVREAFRTLPPDATGTGTGATHGRGPGALTHGDWHLGQIVRYEGAWLLIDVDDLGVGTPAWDLARPAAWFATGFLDPGQWQRFLGAYLGAGGSAVPPDDPWRALDVPARALTVQLAATAVTTARAEGRALDDVERALVVSCARIITAPAPG